MALQVQVERANYENSRFDRTGFQPTINQLFTKARDSFKVNYVFWTRTPGYYDKVLNMLRQPAQTANVAGGLRTACPSAYASCNTN